MTKELNVHHAAEAHYCNSKACVFHDPVNGPLVKAAAMLDAFKAGAAWQVERVTADIAGDRDLKELLKPNEGGYRLTLQGDGPHVLHHFGNPDALRVLRETFATATTLDSRDAATGRLVPRMPTPHDELMAKLEEVIGGLVRAREDYATRSFDHGVRISDAHADLRTSNKMIQALAEAIGNNKETASAQYRNVCDRISAAHENQAHMHEWTKSAVIDVGQKVEAVLGELVDTTPLTVTEKAAFGDAIGKTYAAEGLADAATKEDPAAYWERQANQFRNERDDWHHAYDRLVSDLVHGRGKEYNKAAHEAFDARVKLHDAMRSVGIDDPERYTVGVDLAKPGTDKTVVSVHRPDIDPTMVNQTLRLLRQEVEDQTMRAERAERFWRFWRGISRKRSEQIQEMGHMLDDLTDQPKTAD